MQPHVIFAFEALDAVESGDGATDAAPDAQAEIGAAVRAQVPAWCHAIAYDISHELLRCYLYPAGDDGDDREVVIDNPLLVFTDPTTGDHCIVDVAGVGIVVPPGWSEITIKPRPGCFAFGA